MNPNQHAARRATEERPTPWPHTHPDARPGGHPDAPAAHARPRNGGGVAQPPATLARESRQRAAAARASSAAARLNLTSCQPPPEKEKARALRPQRPSRRRAGRGRVGRRLLLLRGWLRARDRDVGGRGCVGLAWVLGRWRWCGGYGREDGRCAAGG